MHGLGAITHKCMQTRRETNSDTRVVVKPLNASLLMYVIALFDSTLIRCGWEGVSQWEH